MFFGKKDALEVQIDDVLARRDAMERKRFAPHTISTKLAMLSASFEYFKDYGIINRNPATTKSVPRPEKPLQSLKGKSLTVKDVHYLLYTIHCHNSIDLRDFVFIYCVLRLSLRVSEI